MIVSTVIQDIKNRRIVFIAMLFLVVLGMELGFWQLRRAEVKIQKAQQIQELAQQPPLIANERYWTLNQALYHRMQATGHWLPERGIWLQNRPHPLGKDPKTGIATGFNLIMPLQLTSNPEMVLWVNRGWMPRSFEKMNQVTLVKTQTEKVTIEGIVFPDSGKTYQLAPESENKASDGLKIQENLVIDQESFLGKQLLPFVLREQNTETNDGLDKSLPLPKSGVNTHYGYAFQWFGLALMTFLYWVFTAFRKRS
jgi:cytochrome oxidase assembly protein ShyY1